MLACSYSVDGQPARKFRKLSRDDLENFKLVPTRLGRSLGRSRASETRCERFGRDFLRKSLCCSWVRRFSPYQLRSLVKKYHSDFSKSGLSFDIGVFDDVRECVNLVKLDLLDYESLVRERRVSSNSHADFVCLYSDEIDDHTYTEARFRENLEYAKCELQKYGKWSSSTSVRFWSPLPSDRPLTGLMLRGIIFGSVSHCQNSGKVLRWAKSN